MTHKLTSSSFVKPGDEMHFMCPICHEVSLEPRVLQCQHWLCQPCLTALTDKRCHTCRAPYTGAVVHRTLLAWLDATTVKCGVGDCKWEGQHAQFPEHARSCESTLLAKENAKLKALTGFLKVRNDEQQRKLSCQEKELVEVRARKNQLEKERREYSENLLDKLLKKDHSRSPRCSDKKEKKEKKEKPEKAKPNEEAPVALPVVDL